MLVSVGRVGRPHGLDGSFVVERPSENEQLFDPGATLYADGTPVTVAARKRSGGRLVIRLEQRRGARSRARRAALGPARAGGGQLLRLPAAGPGGRRRGRRRLGAVQEVASGGGERRARARLRRLLCRCTRSASAGSTSLRAQLSLHPASRTTANLNRPCRSTSSRWFRTPSGGSPNSGHSPTVLGTEVDLRLVRLPRHDAARERPGGRRAVRRRAWDGVAGRRRRGRARRRLRSGPEHRVIALTPQGRQLDQRDGRGARR